MHQPARRESQGAFVRPIIVVVVSRFPHHVLRPVDGAPELPRSVRVDDTLTDVHVGVDIGAAASRPKLKGTLDNGLAQVIRHGDVAERLCGGRAVIIVNDPLNRHTPVVCNVLVDDARLVDVGVDRPCVGTNLEDDHSQQSQQNGRRLHAHGYDLDWRGGRRLVPHATERGRTVFSSTRVRRLLVWCGNHWSACYLRGAIFTEPMKPSTR